MKTSSRRLDTLQPHLHAADSGQTRLVGGQRVRNDNARLEYYGTVDELDSFVANILLLEM